MSTPPPTPLLTDTTCVAGVRVLDAVYPGGHEYPFHCDGRSRISVVLSGVLLEEARGQDVYASAASVVVKPADVRHRNTFGPDGARMLSVVAPTSLLSGHDEGGLEDWKWHHAGPVGRAAIQFVHAVRRAPADAADDLWSLLEAVSAPRHESDNAPPWLLRAKERIDDEVVTGPSVATLAADAGVHPVALARAFRRAFGCAPTTYRRRLRVRRATDLLASSSLSAVDIALATGFADQSHMCRDVRRELATSPGRLRALLAM